MNNKLITFAREYRGKTQSQLAKEIDGLSQSNLSKFEKGFETLSEDLVDKIIQNLNFPKNFFDSRVYNYSHTAHFRQRATLPKKLKNQIECTYKMIGLTIDLMEESVEFPDNGFISYGEEFDPVDAARHVRQILKLGNEPVKNIFSLLESKGIIIVEVNQNLKFDGVSFITDNGRPVIVINKKFSNDRKRFTIAHELGHLVLHTLDDPAIPKNVDKELEANEFAAEFLMPELIIRNQLTGLRIGDLGPLKQYWLTSMHALVKRAQELNIINLDKARYFYIEMSRLRKNEGKDVYIDKPTLFYDALMLFKNEIGYKNEELAEVFSVPSDFISQFDSSTKIIQLNRNFF